ncbi:uncharacterized protein [Setaria viridis]|uniref:uncharacterized protein n=1 Tax=Setaria viridis TaxID=4556 RepID=UPI003B3A84B4
MPITGGSTLEFENKRQKRDYFRQVNTISLNGSPVKPEWTHMPITFTKKDFTLKTVSHNDAMVIQTIIANWKIGKVLVDTGSSTDIIFTNTFREMKINPHLLEPVEVPLLGFDGRLVKALGKISLPVSFGNLDNARTEHITFDVVEMCYPYFAILG